MQFLPSDPARRNSALVVVLALAGLYLFHARLRIPRVERADVLEARVKEMRERNRRAKSASAASDGTLESRLARYESHLRRLETLIPSSREVAQLLEAVSREERRAGVEMTMMRPQPRIAGEFYEQWSYEVAVRGGYHAVGAFVTAVASLERIVVPGNVVLSGTDGSGTPGEVLATLEVRTYVAAAPDSGAVESVAGASGDPLPRGDRASAMRHPARARGGPRVVHAISISGRGPSPPESQDGPPQTPPGVPPVPGSPRSEPPAPLVFSREVFRYPVVGRRDPFAAPVGVPRTGRTLHLLGLILHEDPALGVALLARGSSEVGDPPSRPLRLRVGERAGDVRLLEIEEDRVIVEIGVPSSAARRRTLLLPRQRGLGAR